MATFQKRTFVLCFGVCYLLAHSAFAQSFKQSYAMPGLTPNSAFTVNEIFSAPPAPGAAATEAFVGEDVFAAPVAIAAIPRIPTALIPLPVPVDPNDMLMQDAFNRSDFGSGYGIASATNPNDPTAVFRLVPNVKLDGAFDTGSPGNANLVPSSFAINGTKEARQSGQFSLRESSANLKTDVQLPTVASQLYLELQADQEQGVVFQQVFGRVGNWLGGAYYSSFTDSGTLPQSIVLNANPAGAVVQPDAVQLQYLKFFESGLMIGAAIENPTTDDFTLVDPTNDVALRRVPDFIARVRYQPIGVWGSVQGALLVRQIAYEELNTTEHFATTCSFSSNARFKVIGDNNFRLGFVSGKAVGSRIFGLSTDTVAAGPVNGALNPLHNLGAYASYQHFWSSSLWSNVAYGYAYADVTPLMTDNTRRAQNGWANLIWNNASGKVGLGLEYQAGEREVGDGRHGFNHHIQLSLQIGKGYQTPSGGTADTASTAPGAASGLVPGVAAPSAGMQGPAAPSAQVYPRL